MRKLKRGPGIVKVNSSSLDDPGNLIKAREDIKEMLSQVPEGWDPHQKLEYFKVAIRADIFAYFQLLTLGSVTRPPNFELCS